MSEELLKEIEDLEVVSSNPQDEGSKPSEDKQEEKKEEKKEENTSSEEKPQDEEVLNNIRKKRKSRATKRIQNLSRRLREKEKALIELQLELERLKKSNNKPVNKVEIKEPNIDDFETYDEYLEALDKYEEALEKRQKEVKEEIKEEKRDIDVESKLYQEKVLSLIEDGREAYDDFEEKIRDDKFPMPDYVLKEILDYPDGADIVYYLAHNHKLAKEIARKRSPESIRKELDKIEELLEQAQEEAKKMNKKVSSAPEPINPVKGDVERNAFSDDFSLFEKEFREYEKKYNDW